MRLFRQFHQTVCDVPYADGTPWALVEIFEILVGHAPLRGKLIAQFLDPWFVNLRIDIQRLALVLAITADVFLPCVLLRERRCLSLSAGKEVPDGLSGRESLTLKVVRRHKKVLRSAGRKRIYVRHLARDCRWTKSAMRPKPHPEQSHNDDDAYDIFTRKFNRLIR